jgi:hypothetical protein
LGQQQLRSSAHGYAHEYYWAIDGIVAFFKREEKYFCSPLSTTKRSYWWHCPQYALNYDVMPKSYLWE